MRLVTPLLLAALLPAFAFADIELARQQVDEQNLSAARATLEQHLAEQPEDMQARFLLARVLSWQGNPEAALPLYQELLEQQPDNADYLLGQGQALLWAGRPGAAIGPLERADRLAPDYAAVQQVLQQARSALPRPGDLGPGIALAPDHRRHELEVSARHDWLDSGLDDWQRQRIDYISSHPQGLSWYGALLREHRFSSWDQGLELGVLLPLGDDWILQPELGYQFSPAFLPEWYADLRLQRRLPKGFLAAARVRRTEYDTTRVDRLALTAERYWSSWRAGYTLNVTDVANAGTPIGHSLGLDYYYDGLSYLGLRGTTGRDEAIEEQQVLTSDVRSVSLLGRHWLTDQWALSWETGHLEQGSLYRRQWFQLGLRRAF